MIEFTVLDDHDVASAFQKVFVSYVKPPALILDPMCGNRLMHKKLLNSTFSGAYKFVFGDININLEVKPQVLNDAHVLPYKSGIFDCVIVDPPYTIYSYVSEDERINSAYGEVRNREWLNGLYSSLNEECYRVLKNKAHLIVKGTDIYNPDKGFKDYYFVYEVISRFSKFTPVDLFIHRFFNPRVGKWKARYKHRISSLAVHSYYMIMKKY
jgi:tRNA G10  N-methylase Trm11